MRNGMGGPVQQERIQAARRNGRTASASVSRENRRRPVRPKRPFLRDPKSRSVKQPSGSVRIVAGSEFVSG
ncbi:hypothetical protein D3H35_01660 [Cohnella faecalis]|uniref:Uncharacterized protein n=1 Tax=Cohnella faecalis TaxID=2315694 RepID=A0A398D2F9_9BACL|nr:hypothetical protein D3H35_01660 [Cohnella faecalis]